VKARRPLKTRQRRAATALAARLADLGVAPDQISYAGLLFALLAAVCLAALPHVGDAARVALLLGAAASIQLRLLANMLDGMVAVEGGLGSATGDLVNDVPDRLADVAILAGAGYAITWVSWGDALGWAAATSALLTAYVRTLGGAVGATQHFCGPMAKPHRMALLTVACLASLGELALGYAGRVLTAALAVVIAGSLATAARRLGRVAAELRAR
jgi:phosphatidylglycerophosphate synthase